MRVLVALFFTIGLVLPMTAQDEPKTINGGVLNGKAVSLPKPDYPESAKADRLEGLVEVEVTIDEAGNVISAAALKSAKKVYRAGREDEAVEIVPPTDPRLIEVAERAAWNAKFSPTYLNGVPTRIKGIIVYRFSLDEKELEEYTGHTNARAPTGNLNGRAISLPSPTYPPAARAVKAAGWVKVQVMIDEGGNVVSATAVSGHPLLRSAAVAAAREAKFAPATYQNEPVKVSGLLTYNFVLPDSDTDK